MQSIDLVFVNQLNSYASTSIIFRYTTIFFAEYSQYVLALIVLYLALSSQKWLKVSIIAVLSAVVARLGIKQLVLLFIHRARPFVSHPEIHPLINSPISENLQSFPSGHAIFFFALAMVIYFNNKKWGIFFFVSAILMGIARIAVGVHYPTDILGGAVLGIICGWLTYKYISSLLGIKNTLEN